MTVSMRGGRSLVAVAALVLVAWPAPAFAHNRLVDSDPADGARVETGPEQVELTFLASLDPDGAEVSVTGPDGASAVAGDAEVDGTSLTVPVDAGPAGEYEIAYEVLSSDGHVVNGTLGFTVTVGEPAPTPTAPPAATSPPEPTPAPTALAGDEADDEAAADEAGQGGAPGWIWPLLALVALAGLGGGYAIYAVRRRRSAAQ